MGEDPRRRVPRTDLLLRDPRVEAASDRLGPTMIKDAVRRAQGRVRSGELAPEMIMDAVLADLPGLACSLRRVLNATGVVVHTNIGRAPLSAAAREALLAASGYVDVEMDLATGHRARRGAGALDALLERVPEAEAALVVNNGAAALLLATTALASAGAGDAGAWAGGSGVVVVSRGEMVEIGDGFRLPELIESTGVRLREVGTTNRTHLRDYQEATGPGVGAILKVHPSNFRVEGFTSAVGIEDLAGLGLPVIADIGSGLLTHDPVLPGEPDAATALRQGAAVVTCSGDKLLGGPQAGILLGKHEIIEKLRRHPMQRALRVDKLTLAALEATLRGPEPPVTRFRHLRAEDYAQRTHALAEAVGGRVVAVADRVGGGGAPGVELPGLAVALPTGQKARASKPEQLAHALRTGDPAVLARVEDGQCLVDLRCIEPDHDLSLCAAIQAALGDSAAQALPRSAAAEAAEGDSAAETGR